MTNCINGLILRNFLRKTIYYRSGLHQNKNKNTHEFDPIFKNACEPGSTDTK